MGRSRYRFGESKYPHFMTCTIAGWLPVFTRPEAVQIIFDSWQFLDTENRMSILGYVILVAFFDTRVVTMERRGRRPLIARDAERRRRHSHAERGNER